MTTVDSDGNTVTPPAYGDYQNGVDALASFLSEVLADGVDPYSLIEELGLDPNDPEGSLELLKQSNLVGIFGAHVFDTDNSDEEATALEGFGPDTLVDAAGRVRFLSDRPVAPVEDSMLFFAEKIRTSGPDWTTDRGGDGVIAYSSEIPFSLFNFIAGLDVRREASIRMHG